MKAAGLVDCFMSSIQNRGLRYTSFISDGDSKSYLEKVASDPYSGVTVQKLECVGHFQKRVGTRLGKLKSENKGKLSDGKPLTGKGRLTDKVINKLQNYFGIAIRQYTRTTVFGLKKSIGDVLYNCTDFTEDETRHQLCPPITDSWCKYQADKINGTNNYKKKPGQPKIICDFIRPVFISLSDEELLKKCLHGKTENNNESLNGVIWKKCPKDVFVGRATLEIGVASAVINFNDDSSEVLNVLNSLKIEPGKITTELYGKRDSEHVTEIDLKSSDQTKIWRKQLRAQQKEFIDTVEKKEGLVYGTEEF